MKIGVIIRSGYPERLAEAQIRALVGTNDHDIIEVDHLYEESDEAIARLRERGCQRIEIFHEDDFNLGRFEGALICEYGHLFERGVEVVPEGFHRIREGDASQASVPQGATQQQQQKGIGLVIFPFNFPTGDLKEIKLFIQDVNTARGMGTPVVMDFFTGPSGPFIGTAYKTCLENVQALNSAKESLKDIVEWGGNGQEAVQNLCGGNNMTVPEYALLLGQQIPLPNLAGISNIMKGDGKLFAQINQMNQDLQAKKVKKNDQAIKEYLKKPGTSGKIKFISDLCIAVQATTQLNPKGVTDKDKSETLKNFMNTMGIMTDLQNVTQQMEKAGLGLVNRAVKFAADEAKKAKKDDKKNEPQKVELLVSHPNFGTVYKSIADAKLFVSNKDLENYLSKKDDKVEGDLGSKASGNEEAATGGKE